MSQNIQYPIRSENRRPVWSTPLPSLYINLSEDVLMNSPRISTSNTNDHEDASLILAKKRKHPSSKNEQSKASKRYQRWIATQSATIVLNQPNIIVTPVTLGQHSTPLAASSTSHQQQIFSNASLPLPSPTHSIPSCASASSLASSSIVSQQLAQVLLGQHVSASGASATGCPSSGLVSPASVALSTTGSLSSCHTSGAATPQPHQIPTHSTPLRLNINTSGGPHNAPNNVRILPMCANACCRNSALMSQMSRQIYDCYLRCRQSNEMYIHKARLREKLYNILRKSFKEGPIDLYIVGSSLNNLGNNHSDVDMCLVLSDRDINQMTEAISILQFVRDQIRIYDFVRKPHLIMAKVPLLKFEDSLSRIEVDLNVNNSVGIRNTHLINCYTRIDRRVQPLVIVVKAWARKRGINNAYNRTLSSYSLVLMVIHYLQSGCQPAVLPCLQQLMPDVFRHDSDIKKLDLHEKLPMFQSKNTQSLSELLIGFLGYYAFTFDYASEVISIRMGRTIDKQTARNYISAKNTPTQWRWICIEEPFDRTNTARSVWDEQAFLSILRVFRSSYYKLRRECNLYSIFH